MNAPAIVLLYSHRGANCMHPGVAPNGIHLRCSGSSSAPPRLPRLHCPRPSLHTPCLLHTRTAHSGDQFSRSRPICMPQLALHCATAVLLLVIATCEPSINTAGWQGATQSEAQAGKARGCAAACRRCCSSSARPGLTLLAAAAAGAAHLGAMLRQMLHSHVADACNAGGREPVQHSAAFDGVS